MRKAANSLVAHFRLLPGNNGRRTGSLPTRASNAADILLQPSSAPSAFSNALERAAKRWYPPALLAGSAAAITQGFPVHRRLLFPDPIVEE